MPFLRLIDSADDMPGEGEPFGMAPEITTHNVTSRDAARDILKYDLYQTADRDWSNGILAEFDSGKNDITRQNGSGYHFSVEYRD